MEIQQLKKAADNIKDFLDDHGIESSVDSVCIEKEWTDFRATIKDSTQMERINTWLQDDLKTAIKDWSDIQISAPSPTKGKKSELRVRVYEINS